MAVALAFAGNAFAAQGPSSSANTYFVPTAPGVSSTAILTTGDSVGGYVMGGIPDGLGAYDNNDGSFTVLMNHEWGATVGAGNVHDHGAIGGYQSRWVINKSTLAVTAGDDLVQKVYGWNAATQGSNATTFAAAFNRLCSADLPKQSALYNAITGLGSQEKIFLAGDESGANGWAVATVATGAAAGNAYILGKMNLSTNGSGKTGVGGWENLLANAHTGDKTVVIGNNDGGTGIMSNSVAVYVGTKTSTGTEADKAGLTNGTLKFINVAGSTAEITNTTTRATNITNGTRFSLNDSASTTFSRPEDGAWDSKNANRFFFVTTDRLDTVSDGVGSQIGQTRLWSLTFDDVTNPDAGGQIDLLIDGDSVNGKKVNMFDNIAVDDSTGHVLLLEDVGNTAHNGKVFEYDPVADTVTQLGKHFSGNGDIGVPSTTPFSQDEEFSGIIDATHLFAGVAGYDSSKFHYYLMVDQQHYPTGSNLTVEGGQLILMAKPVPVPAAVWLMGSALAGFAGLRRKQA